MRRRIRYQSRAAAWCMAAFSSFTSSAMLAAEAPVADQPTVQEAAPYQSASGGHRPFPGGPVALVQPVEFNPVIATAGDRLVLAGTDDQFAPPPLPVASMPRLVPQGSEWTPPQYDIQFQFVQQEVGQPFENQGRLREQEGQFSPGSIGGGASPFGNAPALDFEALSPNVPKLEDKPHDIVSADTAAVYASVDTGQLVSDAAPTVSTQRRSPVNFDPHIRGYRWGQIYTTAGAQWAPIRPDLDSVLAKIDPGLIQNAVVIPGPYGLRYGPGLAYLDIVLIDSPRYYNGPESHARVGINYRGNGDQTTGRVTAYGGGADYGYVFNYTVRTGIDYQAGDGSFIPSSFNSQNFYGQLGFDLSADSRIDFRYTRLDQNDTEYAGQFFDLGYLGADSVTINYVNEDFGNASRFIADAWYNYSRYAGDTNGEGKRAPFSVIDRVERGLTIEQSDAGGLDFGTFNPETNDFVGFEGTTRGDQQVAGGRAVLEFGEAGYTQMDVGVDFRYRQQSIQERFRFSVNDVSMGTSRTIADFTDPDFADLAPFSTNLPRGNSANPGIFLEVEMPVSEYWSSSAGVRLDYAYTTAFNGQFGRRVAPDPLGDPTAPENIINNNSSLPVPAGADLERSDFLYSFFQTNDITLTEDWSAKIGFGHAQRAPTLLDRYADGVFLGIFQSGFSRVIGNPNVQEEKAWQIDTGLSYDGYNFRGKVNLYHAWILDYITYSVNTIPNLGGSRLYQTLNTKYATLSGFEAYGEYDLSDSLQVFGTAAFTEGRDHQINQPLPGIAPLESIVGLRILDGYGGNTWGTEFGARMVLEQERLGALRASGSPAIVTIEERTPGFTTLYVRGYYNVTDNLHLVGGVENLGDLLYQEHLDLRLPASPDSGNPADVDFDATRVYAPGVTPYFGVEATY